DASFEEVYALYEGDECGLSEDNAWLNGCHHTDFDWVILDTETEDVLSKPLSMKEMVLATSEENTCVQGNVAVGLKEIIGLGFDEFLDLISTRLANNFCLLEVRYKVVDTLENERIVLHVSGDVSEILELTEEMAEELKKSIFEAGVNAMEEFLAHPLTYPSDEDMMEVMDEVFEQMPEEEQLRFYRKYVH
ncbi:MAG: hypothetical protein J6K26_09995, partial [Lachnospiraceae bacterium]|nr:hypothetical protein [Lachnospiraceae bacterium]